MKKKSPTLPIISPVSYTLPSVILILALCIPEAINPDYAPARLYGALGVLGIFLICCIFGLMQHIFEFIVKGKGEEKEFHSYYTTKSSRIGKVGPKLMAGINKLRVADGLLPFENEGDVEDFRIRRLR